MTRRISHNKLFWARTRSRGMNKKPLSSVFCPLSSDTGFTLVELIMVIVILGIIGIMGTQFITVAFKGFYDTDTRMEIYEEGKAALVRMEREIHNAIPNALDDDGDTSDIEFGTINEKAMLAASAFGSYTETAPTTSITDQTAALATGSVISIYNRNWTDFTTNTIASRRLYTTTAPSGANMPIDTTYKASIIASSPRQRYYAVDKAVRYYLSGTNLMRSQTTVTESSDIVADLSTATGQPLARDLDLTTPPSFKYTAGTLTRNAVVSIDFTIARDDESVSFHQEVHIRNVP